MKEVENLKTDNIHPIFKKSDKLQESVLGQLESGIIESRDKMEETIMPQDTYSKSEIDLKFENLETKVDSKFDLLIQKIDDGFEKQRLSTEKMLSEFKLDLVTEQQKNKKEFMYWAIGILITLAGIAIPIWFGK